MPWRSRLPTRRTVCVIAPHGCLLSSPRGVQISSGRLTAPILRDLPTESHHAAISTPDDGAFGVGIVACWRGPGISCA